MRNIALITLLFISIISCTTDDSTTSGGETDTTNQNQNRQNVGTSANDILADHTFTSLVIEIVYIEGFEPNHNTITNFVSFIESRCNKSSGITVEKRSIAATEIETYSIQDIADIEIEHRQNYNTNDEIAIWAFFANGNSTNDTGNNLVLGTAYWNTSFVIFEETIKNLSGGAFQPNRTVLETTVITHEIAHLLGLTNLGTDMVANHEDASHPKHCDEETCLMYWATESSEGLDNLIGISSAPQLDAQCIADLQANGGK